MIRVEIGSLDVYLIFKGGRKIFDRVKRDFKNQEVEILHESVASSFEREVFHIEWDDTNTIRFILGKRGKKARKMLKR